MIFARTKIYTVHVNTSLPPLKQKPVFIREGFNTVAFAIPPFWALYQRLWLPALLACAFNLLIVYVLRSHMLSHISTLVVELGFHVVFGFQANDWMRSRLRKKGYVFADVSVADTLLRAQQRYFERYLAAAIV